MSMSSREFDVLCAANGRCERDYNESEELAEQERQTIEMEGE